MDFSGEISIPGYESDTSQRISLHPTARGRRTLPSESEEDPPPSSSDESSLGVWDENLLDIPQKFQFDTKPKAFAKNQMPENISFPNNVPLCKCGGKGQKCTHARCKQALKGANTTIDQLKDMVETKTIALRSSYDLSKEKLDEYEKHCKKQRLQGQKIIFLNRASAPDSSEMGASAPDSSEMGNVMHETLSLNSIQAMSRMTSSDDNPSFTPTVQVIHLKKLSSDRWKVILSDGVHYISGVCATDASCLVDSGVINVNSIIEVQKFAINIVSNGQKICILLGAEQIAVNPGDRIGDPVNIDKVLNGH